MIETARAVDTVGSLVDVVDSLVDVVGSLVDVVARDSQTSADAFRDEGGVPDRVGKGLGAPFERDGPVRPRWGRIDAVRLAGHEEFLPEGIPGVHELRAFDSTGDGHGTETRARTPSQK